MTATMDAKHAQETREKRGVGIAAMNLVEPDGHRFKVWGATIRGQKTSKHVWRDEQKIVRCTCDDYQARMQSEPSYRCEHIYAVKAYLLQKQTPATTTTNEALAKNAAASQPEQREEKRKVATAAAAQEPRDKMTVSEMCVALRVPIPEQFLQDTPAGGGTNVTTINITRAKQLIDERIGAGNWSSRIKEFKQIGNQCIMVVGVTLYGADRTLSHDGEGMEVINKDTFGDTGTNAYAQAFKRAMENFGFARELWLEKGGGQQRSVGRAQGTSRGQEPPDDDIDAPGCACGVARVYKSGKKNGKEWAGWFCKARKCEPQWVDLEEEVF